MTEKAKLSEIFQSRYSGQLQTFKDISYDKTNCVALVNSKINAYNFDNIKNKVKPNLKSADALYFQSKVSFIEFKNVKLSNLKKKQLVEKGRDSLIILTEIVANSTNNIDLSQIQLYYYIVYASKINPTYAIATVNAQLSGKEDSFKKTIKSDLQNKGENALSFADVDLWIDYEFDNKIANC